jgi:hypothetical protein
MRPRATRGLCCAALAVLVTAGAALAGERDGLPPDTLLGSDYPPLAPDPEVVRGEEARLAWAERTLALAETTRDPDLRSDLDLSAASVLFHTPGQTRRCHDALVRALSSRPAGDPLGALGRLTLLRLALRADAPPGTAALGSPAWDYLRQPAPLDATPPEARRDQLARRIIRAEFPPLAVDYALKVGDLRMAGGWALSMALEPDPSWRGSDAERWERVAVITYRLGRRDAARGYNDKARALATDPETQARLAFWRLYLDHGMLSKEGVITQTHVVPGPTFMADLESVLRGLAGNDRVGEFLLAAGSSALQAGAYEVALAVYRRALREPDFVARAHRDPSLWGGLLPAVDAALRLRRFDDADELLASVERIAGEPVPLADAYRARTALARQKAAEGAPLPPVPPPPTPPQPPEPREPPERPRTRGTGELDVPTPPHLLRDDAPASEAADDDAAQAPGGWGGTTWLVFAVLALVALLLVARTRR